MEEICRNLSHKPEIEGTGASIWAGGRDTVWGGGVVTNPGAPPGPVDVTARDGGNGAIV